MLHGECATVIHHSPFTMEHSTHMSLTLTPVLLLVVLLLPLGTAILLRLLWNRVSSQQLAVLTVLLFSLEAVTVIALARSDIQHLQIAGVTVMAPARGLAILPPELQTLVPTNTPESRNATATAAPEQTSAPLATQAATHTPAAQPSATPTILPSATAAPTATPAPTATAAPTATSAPTATATQVVAAKRRYTVEPGDTLRSIAEQFNVTVQAILDANDLTPAQADTLKPGQVLIIP